MARLSTVVKSAAIALLASACAPMFAGHEAEIQHRTIKTSHGPLTLAVKEEGQGRPILLIHGLATSGYTWRKIAPGLAKNHRVIALDLRGFGASDKPIDDHYTIVDQAQAVQAFIEQEDLRDLTVIGHSYGGGVTLALALKLGQDRPSRLKNMVLIDSVAYRQPLPIYFRLMKMPMLAELSMTVVPPEVQAAQAMRIAYFDNSKISARAILEYASPLYSPAGKHALVQTVEHIIPDDIDDVAQRYKTLKIPTQIIWCDEDKVVPLVLGERLNADIPTARLRIIHDCGHLPHEEKPEETLEAIEDFLAKNGG